MTPNLKLARLVGSYHAHRGACNEHEFLHWWDSLTHEQHGLITWYQQDGVAMFDYIALYHTEPERVITASEVFRGLVQKLGEDLAASGISAIAIERIRQRAQLNYNLWNIRLFGWRIIPESWCDWLSAYWPLWLMPWRLGRKVKAIAIRLLKIKSPSLEQL